MSMHEERGLKAQQAGEAFETKVDRHHEKAKELGILAHVVKNEPHSKMIKGQLTYTSAGVADRTGTFEGGMSLAAECKSVSTASASKDIVEPLQQDHMNRVAKAGAFAFLLIEFKLHGEKRWYAVPWLEVPWKMAQKNYRVYEADILAYRIFDDCECYLEKYHSGGASSSPYIPGGRKRALARE